MQVRSTSSRGGARRGFFVGFLMAGLVLHAASALAAHSRGAEVVATLTAANAELSAADRAEKFALMKASPQAFFRGSNILFWRDLGAARQLASYGGAAATRTFLGGDQHVGNFGAFADDQGDVVYAINDFDEAVIADYQLDVWRAAVSLMLLARELGFGASTQATVLDAFTESYLAAMVAYDGSSQEVSRKFLASNTYGPLNNFLRDTAANDSRVKMLNQWTVTSAGVRRLNVATNPELAPVPAAVEADLRARFAAYRATLSGGGTSIPASAFTIKSVAQRLHAGLGSLGSARYYVLIEGATTSQDDDRILDVKAQRAPSAAPYIAAAAWAQTEAASGGDPAVRGAIASKALGYRVDDLLGTMVLADGKSYSVRERSPYKETFDTTTLTTATRLQHLAEQWATVLATQHARADRDWSSAVFAASLDGEVNARTRADHAGFRALVRAIANDYADQVELDYASFTTAF
jgi:uncharacterized protein (DUF2252 family)